MVKKSIEELRTELDAYVWTKHLLQDHIDRDLCSKAFGQALKAIIRQLDATQRIIEAGIRLRSRS